MPFQGINVKGCVNATGRGFKGYAVFPVESDFTLT